MEMARPQRTYLCLRGAPAEISRVFRDVCLVLCDFRGPGGEAKAWGWGGAASREPAALL